MYIVHCVVCLKLCVQCAQSSAVLLSLLHSLVHSAVWSELCVLCTLCTVHCAVYTVQGPAQSRSLLCTVLCTVLNTMHSSAISAQPSQNFVCTSLHSLVHSFSQFCAQSIVLLCYKCTAQSGQNLQWLSCHRWVYSGPRLAIYFSSVCFFKKLSVHRIHRVTKKQ